MNFFESSCTPICQGGPSISKFYLPLTCLVNLPEHLICVNTSLVILILL